jgi:tetratricopeptide (TPR) repeat protein
LYHFPWCDDFSAARNESLRHASGDWLFWMDSDDTIPPECGRGLRELVENQNDPSVVAYVMQVHCPGGGEAGDRQSDVTIVDHVKLFRNLPELRFDGRMHEQILGAVRRLGGDLAWTELYVSHSGSDQSPAAQARKLERDLRLLSLELAERPDHPFTLFNIGMTHVHGSRFSDGAEYLRRSIAQSRPEESHLRKAFALLVYAEMRQKRFDQAHVACREGRRLFPNDVELLFREGVLMQELGRPGEARAAYLGVLNCRDERHFSSVDRGLTGFKARQNLAIVATSLGDLAEAERQWAEVVREAPHYRQGWRGLGETLLQEQRFADAERAADELTQDRALRPEGLLLKCRAAMGQSQLDKARAALDAGWAEFPADIAILHERCHFLFGHGTDDEAEEAIRALIEREPTCAEAYHNLGVVLMRCGRHEEAVVAYRQSLRYRPNYYPTFLNLGYALKDGGRLTEAATAWEQAARLEPNDPVPRRELSQIRRGVVGVRSLLSVVRGGGIDGQVLGNAY